MPGQNFSATVRQISPFARVIDIHGEINTFSTKEMTEVYTNAVNGNVHTVILNFTDVTYMNSYGIGMLVMLLIRARRDGKNIVGYGLSQHYQNIFKLTRLDEVIQMYPSEEIALASAVRYDLPERES
jgi:anti-sigma B factor antagonist